MFCHIFRNGDRFALISQPHRVCRLKICWSSFLWACTPYNYYGSSLRSKSQTNLQELDLYYTLWGGRNILQFYRALLLPILDIWVVQHSNTCWNEFIIIIYNINSNRYCICTLFNKTKGFSQTSFHYIWRGTLKWLNRNHSLQNHTLIINIEWRT